jgi:hypothetical protein
VGEREAREEREDDQGEREPGEQNTFTTTNNNLISRKV